MWKSLCILGVKWKWIFPLTFPYSSTVKVDQLLPAKSEVPHISPWFIPFMISFPLPLQLVLVQNICNYPGTGDLAMVWLIKFDFLNSRQPASQKDLVSLAHVYLEAWVALGAVLPFYKGFFGLHASVHKVSKVKVKLQEGEEKRILCGEATAQISLWRPGMGRSDGLWGQICVSLSSLGTRLWLELRQKQSVWFLVGCRGKLLCREKRPCRWLCSGSWVPVHQRLVWMSGFGSPRHQAKGLFLPRINRLQGLASALRFSLPGLVKKLRSAQTREINLLHLLSKIMDSGLQRKRRNLCFVAYLCDWSDWFSTLSLCTSVTVGK